jgi:hypothetical protein
MTAHPYLKRVFARMMALQQTLAEPKASGSVEVPVPTYEKVEHTWKIDDQSPAIQINDKNSVQVLMESSELAETHKVDKAVAILIGVNAGSKINITGTDTESDLRGGRVLHVMSHFTKQKSARDGHTMKNLLLNYLIEANERHLTK